MKKINERHRRFVSEYLLDGNATRAAIAAGYSESGAENAGYRLLRNDDVKSKLVKSRDKINTKLEISVERVTLELARLAFFDSRQFFNSDGTAKPITELDEDSARAIAGFECEEQYAGRGDNRQLSGYIKKFKLADKGQNLERLGRHLQMFPSPPQELKVTDASADSSVRLIKLLAAAVSRVSGAPESE